MQEVVKQISERLVLLGHELAQRWRSADRDQGIIHAAGPHRESAALRGSPCPGLSTGLMLQQPLLDAIRMIEIVQREVAEHDENGIPVVLGMRS